MTLAMLLAPILPTFVTATTWVVTYDPDDDMDRIGQVAVQAISGDTILVESGIYFEHIPLEGKSLTFIGLGGSAETILDGGKTFLEREGSIIYMLTGAGSNLTLEGFTLRNGTGAPFRGYADALGGGAVLWGRETGEDGALRITNCDFEGNTTGSPDNIWVQGGGAVLAYGLNEVWIEDCSFSGNTSFEGGGDIFLLPFGPCVISGCSFSVTEIVGNGGRCIHLVGGGELTVCQCSFLAETGGGFRDCIVAEPSTIEIVESEFIDRGGPLATRIRLYFGGVGSPSQGVLINRNLFWNEAGPDSAADASLTVGMPNGAYEVTNNTFVRCGTDIQNSAEGPPIIYRNNIVARGEAIFFIPSGGDVECNDLWGSWTVDHIGNIDLFGNIAVDPLFCDEETGDLRLAIQSPCAPDNAPEGCGRIGALPAECDLTPVERISSGEIKARFK